MQRQMMRHIRRVPRILIRQQRKRILQRPLRTPSLIMRKLRRYRFPEINSLLKKPIIIIMHRAIACSAAVAAAISIHLIEPPMLMRVVELHVLIHHVVVGVGVVTVAVAAAGGGAGPDLGAAVDHLDELAALEAEVDVLVLFEYLGVVRFGELEGAVDVAVEDGDADYCGGVSGGRAGWVWGWG